MTEVAAGAPVETGGSALRAFRETAGIAARRAIPNNNERGFVSEDERGFKVYPSLAGLSRSDAIHAAS
jgi:hypothetical protein